MTIYSATLSAISVAAAQDVFELVAPSTNRVGIREIILSQYSDFGAAEDEIVSLLVMRGHTTSGSGGGTVTPAPLNPYMRASGATVERNNTTLATDGSPVTLLADAFNVRAGWTYRAPLDDNHRLLESGTILLQPSQRLVVRITLPADALTMNATLMFEELAKAPVS